MGRDGQRTFMYVGTWPLSRRHGAERVPSGIHVYEMEQVTGKLTEIQYRDMAQMTSMLCVSPNQRFLYATDEDRDRGGIPYAGGGVLAFSIDPETGMLMFLNEQPSIGVCPTYVSVDRTGQFVFTANHGSRDRVVRAEKDENGSFALRSLCDEGSVAMLRVKPEGTLGPAADMVAYPDACTTPIMRVSGVHAHCCVESPSGKYLLVCEKGGDRIYVSEIDREHGKLRPAPVPFCETRPHIAPRHAVFHPSKPYVFVCNEIGATVDAYAFSEENGALRQIDFASTIQEGKHPLSALNSDIQVHKNGRFLYVSVRTGGIFFPELKDNLPGSIAVFSIAENGSLRRIQTVLTEGNNVRSISFDPACEWLFAASTDDDVIQRFRCDPETGLLREGAIAAKPETPSCIRFLTL